MSGYLSPVQCKQQASVSCGQREGVLVNSVHYFIFVAAGGTLNKTPRRVNPLLNDDTQGIIKYFYINLVLRKAML